MKIGYACKVIGVPGTKLSSLVLKNATEERIRSVIRLNLKALEDIVNYNIRNDIKLFRISSDIIPLASHPVNTIMWWEEFRDDLLKTGETIKQAKMRVSMHPGQYTVLNSPDLRVVDNAKADLQYHARFLDMLGVDSKNKLVLHVGGVYNDKQNSKTRFIDNYKTLADNVKSRLIIENDDKSYNVEDVLEIASEINCPVVYDNLHNHINLSDAKLTDVDWINECAKTWSENDGDQKIHYSQQKIGGLPGAHSDTIFIDEFVDFYKKVVESRPNKDIDIMLEVKDKNLSAIKSINTALSNQTASKLENEWSRYKYFVMSRSTRIYNYVRELLKNKESKVAIEFYQKLEEVQVLPEDRGTQINAAQHIWGYIRESASKQEKLRYEKLIDDYKNGKSGLKSLKSHLLRCAEKQKIEYLINSLYFYIE